MGGSESGGFSEPDYSLSPSEHDSPDAEGVADDLGHSRPPPRGKAPSGDGHLDSKVQSLRDPLWENNLQSAHHLELIHPAAVSLM